MTDDASIHKLPAQRPTPERQVMPDFSKPDVPANVVPLKKPKPPRLSHPKRDAVQSVWQPALLLAFPVHRVRATLQLPVKTRMDNIVTMFNAFWLDAFMRKIGLSLRPHQLVITHEKRLLLVDYTLA